jgi:RNA polymerase sigma-70 factor, ECF subfamily
MPVPDAGLRIARWLTRAGTPVSTPLSLEAQNEVIALFDEHRTRLLRYVLSIGLSVHDAEEIVQDVFLSLFRHLQLGRPRDNLRGWLFRVAHNLALKGRQANQSRPDSAELDEGLTARQADPGANPEEQVASRQRQECLLAAFRALPERDQYCLHLRSEGLRYREIADVLGISLGSVSISLTRSIARLERADRR